MVIELTGSRSRIVHRPLPQDDPRQRRPDISKADDVLRWAPRTALREGLIRTIAYFEELLQRRRHPAVHQSRTGAERPGVTLFRRIASRTARFKDQRFRCRD